MKARNENLTSIDAIMDANSASREHLNVRSSVRKHTPTAWDRSYVMPERRKKMTQSELAEKNRD